MLRWIIPMVLLAVTCVAPCYADMPAPRELVKVEDSKTVFTGYGALNVVALCASLVGGIAVLCRRKRPEQARKRTLSWTVAWAFVGAGLGLGGSYFFGEPFGIVKKTEPVYEDRDTRSPRPPRPWLEQDLIEKIPLSRDSEALAK